MMDTDKQFEDLLIENYSHIEYLCLKYNHNNQEEANLLLSVVTEKIWRKRSKFEIGTNFRAWISVITYNEFINEYRRKKKKAALSLNDESIHIDIFSDEDIEKEYEKRQTTEELHKLAKEILSTKEYKVFILMMLDYNYKEIAEITNRKHGTIKSQIFGIKNKLSEVLGGVRTGS